MKYLIDTCVISELAKKKPEQRVAAWISGIEESKLFLSVLTIGELLKGIEKLPDGDRRDRVSEDLQERFSGRIAVFDLQAAAVWAKIQAEAEAAGKVMPVMDSMIAATAIANGLAVATRNIADINLSQKTEQNN